jgi:hypothetical protein
MTRSREKKHRRRSQPPFSNSNVGAGDDEYTTIDQNLASGRRPHGVPDPAVAQASRQNWSTMPNQRTGIKPGAPPAERFIPPKPKMPKQEMGLADGHPGNMARSRSDTHYQRSNAHEASTSRTMSGGYGGPAIVDSGVRMSDGRDPFATSQAFLSGYENGITEAIFPLGGYAPGYDDGYFNTSSRAGQDDSPVEGLGLLGVPERTLQTGSVTTRSTLFRSTPASSTRVGVPSSSASLSVPPPSHSEPSYQPHTLNDILGANHGLSTASGSSENGMGPVGRGRSRPASISGSLVSSWGTVTNVDHPPSDLGSRRGSLASLEMVNNFNRVVMVAPGEAAAYEGDDEIATPRLEQLGTDWDQGGPSSALGIQFGPSTQEASHGRNDSERVGHSRSLSMPTGGLDMTESENQHPFQNASSANRDQPRERATSSLQTLDTQVHFSEPLQPTNSNGLGLTFDEPVTTHSSTLTHRPVDSHNVSDGPPCILAPTPRHSHNVVRSWQNSSP